MKKQRFKHPSVTEVLEPYADLSMIRPEVLKAAQIRGTIVHAVCAGVSKFGIAINTPYKYKGYVQSFRYFHDELEEIEWVEGRIENDAVRLCGQPDLVAKRYQDPHERVWEIKTPVAFYKTWAGQTSAYKWLYEQKTGRVTDMPGHVQLKEDGGRPKVTIMTPDQYKTELEMFFKVLTAYHHYA